jgi:hypothetical protein
LRWPWAGQFSWLEKVEKEGETAGAMANARRRSAPRASAAAAQACALAACLLLMCVSAFKESDFKVRAKGDRRAIAAEQRAVARSLPLAPLACRRRAARSHHRTMHASLLRAMGAAQLARRRSRPRAQSADSTAPPPLRSPAFPQQKCADADFCRRNRGVTGTRYAVDPASVRTDGGALSAWLRNEEAPAAAFWLQLLSYSDGTLRLLIDEQGAGRYQVPDILEAGVEGRRRAWASATPTAGGYELRAGAAVVALTFRPFRLEVSEGGAPALVLNGRSMLALEHRRAKGEGDPPGWWSETFGGHVDSKPRGPEALSLDLGFPGALWILGEGCAGLFLRGCRPPCWMRCAAPAIPALLLCSTPPAPVTPLIRC